MEGYPIHLKRTCQVLKHGLVNYTYTSCVLSFILESRYSKCGCSKFVFPDMQEMWIFCFMGVTEIEAKIGVKRGLPNYT